MQVIERQSGVAIWRQIADQIHAAISDGTYDAAAAIPGEVALAERFGVNRHTMRAALAALVEEGVLKREKGRGTFIVKSRRLTYPIGLRTRLGEGLQGQVGSHNVTVLDAVDEQASDEVASALALPLAHPVLRVEATTVADGVPLSRSTSWFDAERFAGFDAAFRKTRSITAAFKTFSVTDYFRETTAVTAAPANAADRSHLKLPPGGIILVARSVNVDTQKRPIQYAITRFVADRVELVIRSGVATGNP